jgi:uncharacterized protein (DUF2345 family)
MDLYPAEVVLPDGQVMAGARVMVTRDEQILVWYDLTGIAKVAYKGKIIDASRYPERSAIWNQQRLSATTVDGSLHVNASAPRNCNCGGSSLALLDERSAEIALAGGA